MPTTKYINKLAGGRNNNGSNFTSMTSQGNITPNGSVAQYGANPSNVSLSARSVQIYSKVRVWPPGMSHGPLPFIASGNTGAVKMSMAYGYDCDAIWGLYNAGFDFITSGQVHLGSNGTLSD